VTHDFNSFLFSHCLNVVHRSVHRCSRSANSLYFIVNFKELAVPVNNTVLLCSGVCKLSFIQGHDALHCLLKNSVKLELIVWEGSYGYLETHC
jgi:hypothetical protein